MILSYDPTFDMGYSSFFREYGNVKYDIVNSSSGYLLKVYNKENSGHRVYQDLYIDLDCGNEGDHFLVKGRFQLRDTSDNLIECDPKLMIWHCDNIVVLPTEFSLLSDCINLDLSQCDTLVTPPSYIKCNSDAVKKFLSILPKIRNRDLQSVLSDMRIDGMVCLAFLLQLNSIHRVYWDWKNGTIK